MFAKELRTKAKDFLKSRKNANNLINIISVLEAEKDVIPAILALELIFTDVLKKAEMCNTKINQSMEQKEQLKDQTEPSAEEKYQQWLRDCYEDAIIKFLSLIEKGEPPVQLQALSTIMKFIALEGKYPLKKNVGRNHFPTNRLQAVVSALLSSECSTSHLINRFQEYTAYRDVVYFVWLLLPNILTKQKQNNECFIKNFLEFAEKNALPKPNTKQEEGEELQLLCDVKGAPGFRLDNKLLRRNVRNVWRIATHWKHTSTSHRKLLVLLTEKLMDHLGKPLVVTDYLMGCLDMGGAVSMLALHGILTLIQSHNLHYPNIYKKLYSMFQPDIFHTKYRKRFFYLTDTFLSSTHLPEALVAAFIKRLARLTLVAPPEIILFLLRFIGNLLLRHPELKRLAQHPTGGEVDSDPFDMKELDPYKSGAAESSLWEVATLQHHILPSVANAARFINQPLPSVEWDLSPEMENEPSTIFEREIKKKTKDVTLTFMRPQGMSLPTGEKLMHYWCLD